MNLVFHISEDGSETIVLVLLTNLPALFLSLHFACLSYTQNITFPIYLERTYFGLTIKDYQEDISNIMSTRSYQVKFKKYGKTFSSWHRSRTSKQIRIVSSDVESLGTPYK